MRRENTAGGGAQTNINGLHFEQTTSLREIFENHPEFSVKDDFVYRGRHKIGLLCGKGKIYESLLRPKYVDPDKILSRKLYPDEAIKIGNTVYIIEKKFQSGPGSVDEKLQTCDFKKKQYAKLLAAVGLHVEYIYVLNDWFKRPEYTDVHNYIKSVGCHFFFNEIPLAILGL
jgi:hypothetical protein